MCEYAEENWRGDNRGYGYFQALLGECYYERNQLAVAEKCLVKGRRIGLDLLDIGLLLPTTLTMVQMKQQQGMHSTAQLLLDETKSRLEDRLEPVGRQLLDSCRIRLIMGSNEPDQVSRWVTEHRHRASEALDHNHMYEYLTLLRAFLYLRQYEKGISFGERLLQYSQSLYRFYYKAEIHLLLAFLNDSSMETPSAVNHLRQALEIGQQEGYFRLFLNEWDRVKSLFTKYGQQLRQTTAFHDELYQQGGDAAIDYGEQNRAVERLTPSESKVLKLLIEGRSNAFIADRLSNSVETVKSHCKSIYKKLELKNREEVRTYFEKTF
nr:LuxR C-terminal-related transcriptional regulator [Cohnella zeiphila]